MVACNTTLEYQTVDGEVKYSGGYTFHELGLVICAVFGLIAIIIACYLMLMHATHYSKPAEQKHIIRILFMIPIYALVSFLSYYYYTHAIYWQVLRDCYEAFAIAAFFSLLCNYVSPNLHDQKEYFRTVEPKNWIWPLTWVQRCTGGQRKGLLRIPRSGLTWFNIEWVGVFQYCFIRIFFTIVSVITEAAGDYCEDSLSPAFAHVWVEVFEGLSVTIAMYCLIQFYYQLKEQIRSHSPLLKIVSIKLVIFFCFWQTWIISFVASRSKPEPHIAYPDIKVGIPSILLCIEMALFAVLHIFAYPWRKEYSLSNLSDQEYNSASPDAKPQYKGGRLGIKAFLDAGNPWDLVKASARGFRWLFVGVKHRHNDSSYQKSGGPSIIARPADAWRTHPDNSGSKVAMQPLNTQKPPEIGVTPADNDFGTHYDGPHYDGGAGQSPYGARDGLTQLQPTHSAGYTPYSPYPDSTTSNPFRDEDTAYHGSMPLRSQEDVNEYVRAGSFDPQQQRSDPFGDSHRTRTSDEGHELLRDRH